ncbi:hypothetical protein ACFXTO_037899 [Malus domestica]
MDVVTANPKDWEFDPFSLSIEGDKLRGRGTTDCLGHVALLTELMRRLAETKPKLKSTVVAVFIANEENSSISGVGVDALVKDGLVSKLRDGPLFWIDMADKQPCIGTGGMIPWKLHVTRKLFHSGLAHKVNSLLQLQEYVDDINENIGKVESRGPVSKYVLPDENLRGSLTLSFYEAKSGVVCDLNSRGFHVLCKATEEVVGHLKPYSITGSLPLIRELQDEGFDVQTAGYSLMATYHAKNEYYSWREFPWGMLPSRRAHSSPRGYQVFISVVSQLED